MAKPSITNIQPPSKTVAWTPSTTNWDLNDGTQWAAAKAAGFAADDEDGAFAGLTAKVNVPVSEAVDMGDLGTYDYIFYGVNGGEDETIKGKTFESGVIVTGNGKDNITGGNWGDLIFAGNGKDVVNGGGGNDILFGENGADQLNGNSDNGHAVFVAPVEGETVVTQGGEPVFVWDEDPNGTYVAAIHEEGKIRKEGVFVENTDDGPVFHTVFSFTPETGGTFTLAYYQNGEGPPHLDGPGEPDPDYFSVNLVAGNTYYYSFENSSDAPIFVMAFSGNVVPPNTPPAPGQVLASSQAMPGDYDLTTTGGTDGTLVFEAGDELIGGNGPDQFIYDASEGLQNVDLIWDYNQGEGSYNPLEGDVLVLKNTGITNVADLVTTSDHDVDGDGNNDLVIYLSQDHAIGLVGITDISQVNVTFG